MHEKKVESGLPVIFTVFLKVESSSVEKLIENDHSHEGLCGITRIP